MTTIINPKSGRSIAIGSTTFKTLIKEGYTHDLATGTLIKTGTTIVPTINATLKPTIIIPHVIPKIIITQQPIVQPQLTPDDLTIKSLGMDNSKFDHIIHLSDTHIPLDLHVDRHEEYISVFSNLCEKIQVLANKSNIAIAITGDLLHVKLALEPETVMMARKFLKSLASIAPVLLIIGNHDFAENNKTRMDTMTTICDDINIHCLKYTGLYQLGNIIFAFSSLFDGKFIRYQDIQNSNKLITYKLYHGTVLGSVNCNGTINKTSHAGKQYPSIADFQGYNAVMLGHIHKYQKLTEHMAYAGSLIQQNHGESIDNHGFLIWDTKTHLSKFVEVNNNYVFIDAIIQNAIVTNKNELTAYADKHLRIRCHNTNTSASEYNQIQSDLRNEFQVVKFKTGKPVKGTTSIILVTPSTQQISQVDQESALITKHAKQELYDGIIKLHNEIKTTNKIANSATWNIVSLEFKNMFIYGNDHINTINFTNGVTNVCSPNMTGKSSILGIITFALFGMTSHNSSQKTDIVHMGTTEAYVKLIFNHNGQNYLIEKNANKKTRAGVMTFIYSINFYRMDTNGLILLNGKDSTSTNKIIGEYVGAFDSFAAHNIISTKLGASLIQMTPAEKLKHFHNLFNTSQYQTCVDTCKELHKSDEKSLANLQGQLIVINNEIKDVNIESETKLLTIIEPQLQQFKDKLTQIITDNQIFASQKGKLETEIKNLDDQRHPQPKIPELDEITLNNQILQNLLLINQADPDNSLRTTISDSKSLKKIINTYQTSIQPCKYPQELIDNTLSSINDELNQHLNNKPQSTESILINLKAKLELQLEQSQQEIKTLEKFKNTPEINIDLKPTLTKQKIILDKKISQLESIVSIDNKTSISQCKLALTHLKPHNTNETPIQLQTLIAVNSHKLSTLENTIKSIQSTQMIEHTLTQEQLNNSIKQELSIPNKIKIDTNEIKRLQSEIQLLTTNYQFTDCSTINKFLVSLSFDQNDNTLMPRTQINQLINLVNAIENGEFSQVIKLNNQLNQLLTKQEQNHEIDNQIKINNEIKAQNLIIHAKLNWLKHKQLNNEHKSLTDHNQSLLNTIKYLELTNQIELLEAYEQLKNLLTQLEHITNYEKKRELIYLEINIIDNKTQLETTIQSLNWYKLHTQIKTKLIEWQNYQKINKLNLINQSLIEETHKQLELAELIENNLKLNTFIKIWNDIAHNQIIDENTQSLKLELPTLEQKIDEQNKTISKMNSSIYGHEKKLALANQRITNYHINFSKADELKKVINELALKIQIYTEYERLFCRTLIPFELIKTKLDQFNTQVNEIFTKYTKYEFKCDQSESGKLVFSTANRQNGCVLEPERLSGFETVILQLAINRAILSISDTFRCEFIVVDESLDCIDKNRFVDELPNIIEAIRQYYQSVLLISHRDVSNEIIDQHLKICNYGTYSTINDS